MAHVDFASAHDHALRGIERDLHELALELRRVPIDECSRKVHVRALELKRDLRRHAFLDERALRTAQEEIRGLIAEAIRLRRELLTGRQARAASLARGGRVGSRYAPCKSRQGCFFLLEDAGPPGPANAGG